MFAKATPEEWRSFGLAKRWMIMTRAAVLLMTVFSASLALLLADDGPVPWARFVVLVVGVTGAHALNNILNDMTDFYNRVDTPGYYRNQYAIHALADGHVTMRGALAWAVATAVPTLSCAAFFVLQPNGRFAVQLTVVGSFFLLFYTWPLKYIGMGEPAVFIVWGPLMIGGGHAMLTGASHMDWAVVYRGLPYALGVTGVIFGKHIDKLAEDRAKGIYTLPVLLGDSASRVAAQLLLLAQYGVLAHLVVTEQCSRWALVAFAVFPRFLRAAARFAHEKPARQADVRSQTLRSVWPNYFAAIAFEHNALFGAAYVGALVVARVLHN